jgi:hypothetical protein
MAIRDNSKDRRAATFRPSDGERLLRFNVKT